MLKAIVIDDEKSIREGLSGLIEYLDKEWTVVGVYGSAIEAEPAILQEKPHLVICDVQMPSVGGLDLIESVHNRLPETHFSILSGYSEFEYARRALRVGVADYLLKPVDWNQLKELLSKVKNKVDQSLQTIQQEKERERMYFRSLQERKEKWLSDLLDGLYINADQIYRETEELGLIQHEDISYYVAVISPDPTAPEDHRYLLALRYMVQDLASRYEIECHVLRRNDYVAALFLLPGGSLESVISSGGASASPLAIVEMIARELIDNAKIYTHLNITVGISRPVENLSSVHGAFLEAMEAMEHRIFYGGGKVYTYMDKSHRNNMKSEFLLNSFGKFMNDCTEGQLSEFTHNFLTELTQRCGERRELLWNELSEFILEWYQICTKHGYSFGDVFSQSSGSLLQELKLNRERLELEGWLQGKLLMLHRAMQERKTGNSPNLIKKAKEFIHAHLGEQLTLAIVAQHVHLHPVYFSYLFSTECEESFLEYLTKCRIEKAKELLWMTNHKVSDIAAEVGYQSSAYFSRIFQKQTGLTPSQYRETSSC